MFLIERASTETLCIAKGPAVAFEIKYSRLYRRLYPNVPTALTAQGICYSYVFFPPQYGIPRNYEHRAPYEERKPGKKSSLPPPKNLPFTKSSDN